MIGVLEDNITMHEAAHREGPEKVRSAIYFPQLSLKDSPSSARICYLAGKSVILHFSVYVGLEGFLCMLLRDGGSRRRVDGVLCPVSIDQHIIERANVKPNSAFFLSQTYQVAQKCNRADADGELAVVPSE